VANSIRHLPALLIGFVAGAAAACGALAISTRLPPPIPVLPPATEIRVTLYPSERVGEVATASPWTFRPTSWNSCSAG
jgi:hypothetical protein